ncbi:MAG: CPBP family intramembrane metalloprotease [Candidatus Thorarchaeota archaeon]|nr:CPBP family intramembrane metalloprotease [Candidatus Thorarchaeota archaeon]
MEGILRTGTGEIRFLWKLAVTFILLIVLIVISRLSLILMVQQVLIFQGTLPSAAFENAQIFVAESSEGQAIASSLDLALILLLVFLLVTRIEKHEFHLADIGLNLQRDTLPLVVFGIVIGCGLFLGAVMFGVLLHTIGLPVYPHLEQWPLLITLIASVIFYGLNSFWQEIVFRGYLQTQAVEEYGGLLGISTVTVAFVLFHGLVQTLTPIGIISGLLLFGYIGLLYEKTRSLYLVGVIHAVLNFLPVLFNLSWQGLESVITYGIALVLLILLIRRTEQSASTDSQ